MTDEVAEVVVTGPSAEWVAAFTRRLVDDRLAACGHNLSPIRSIYRWRGEVYDETEARVALHTRMSLVPRITQRANDEHPYEVPCVIATAVTAGNPAYLQWVLDETAPNQA
jgi:periplasmic divalent cation tolerance protein